MLTLQTDQLGYSPEYMAAFLAVQALSAQVDAIFGDVGDVYFLGLAPVELSYEGERTDLELEALVQMDEWKARIENIETYQPVEQEVEVTDLFALFDAHDPLDFVA